MTNLNCVQKIIISVFLCGGYVATHALDLSLVSEVEYAKDHDEQITTAIVGLELYSKKYGLSFTAGVGYENTQADFFGNIEEKSNQGLYLKLQSVIPITTF